MEEPTPAPQTPEAGYTPVPLREGSDYRPPSLTIWGSGYTFTSASHSLEPTSGNCLTQFQAKHRTLSSAPESTPPGRWALVQLAHQGPLGQPLQGRPAVARGKGLKDPARVLLPPRVQPPTTAPTPLVRSPEIRYLSSQPFQPRTPTPRDPPPALAPRTRSIYPVATLPLSSSHPGLSWAVRPSTPRPHLKGQRYTVSPQGLLA